MATGRTQNPDFLNGVPELLVLSLLAERAMHGYDLVRSIKSASAERFEFGEGSIYPVLHKLERAGLLASRRERVENRSRVVYRVTAAGAARLSESTATWASIVRAVERVLHGGSHAEPGVA